MRLIYRPLKPVLFICINLIVVNIAISQESELSDSTSTLLGGITIYGLKPLEFVTGSNQQNLDSTLKVFPSSSLSNILQRSTSVYIKNYGNQMLSTISLRGTGPGHTATLWNGLNIGSPTLGQFDFSQAPSIVPDELILHYGGSSALFGNEAIGGTIILQSQSEWRNRPSLFIYQDAGSFGSMNTMATFRTNIQNFESSTKAYFSKTENDFPFVNILLPGSPLEYQKNAKSKMNGVVQDFYWRPKTGQQASVHAWLHSSNRQLQPSMANPYSEDTQEDLNIRLQTAWRQSGKAGYVNASLGFIHDYMLYNKSITTSSDQTIFHTDLGRDINSELSINIGGSFQHITVETVNYLHDVWENRWDIYTWLKYSPYKKLSIAANLRSAATTSFSAPLSPSLGTELILADRKKRKIIWKSVASTNYRIPTLNDRYWNPGGNPLLKPEKSLSIESGFNYRYSHSSLSYDASITLYNMSIDNWIIWLPYNDIWQPENIREVRNSGIEMTSKGNFNLTRSSLFWKTSYTYTKSINLTQLDPYDNAKGKQLPYVPYHNLLLSIGIKRSSWKTEISINYTGKRFTTTDNTDSLDDFWLTDFMIGKSFNKISFDGSIENILNTTYFHIPYRSMPGRNYRLGISLKI